MLNMKVSDTIQFLALVMLGLSMIAGFWTYCESHFALATDQQEITIRLGKHDELFNVIHDQLLRVEFATGAHRIRLDPRTHRPVSE